VKGRGNIRKKAAQKLRHLKRKADDARKVPVPVEKPSVTRGLISEMLERPSPLVQALLNQQRLQQP